MKIYSWNVLFENRHPERVLEYIRTLDFDVLCLQEVPESMLPRLRELPLQMHEAVDTELTFSDKVLNIYCVILSKHALTNTRVVPFTTPLDTKRDLPLRGRVFTDVLGALKLWPKISLRQNRHGIYADVQSPEGTLRVFCLHLSLTYPRARHEELELAFAAIDCSEQTVICGDFNIFDTPIISMTNWLLGGTLIDGLRPKRERVAAEKLFESYGLTNPLCGSTTHPFSHSQLDHILLSATLSMKRCGVVKDSVGSDHRPIFVELA